MNNWRDKLFVTLQYLIPQHALSRLVGMLARSEVPWIKTTSVSYTHLTLPTNREV